MTTSGETLLGCAIGNKSRRGKLDAVAGTEMKRPPTEGEGKEAEVDGVLSAATSGPPMSKHIAVIVAQSGTKTASERLL